MELHRQYLEALDSVWEEERRRQIMAMKKRIQQRKAKAEKMNELKLKVDE